MQNLPNPFLEQMQQLLGTQTEDFLCACAQAPASALLCQAIGAERIEALCDAFTDWLEAEVSPRGLFLRPRFSPGYGDLPLTLQREILRALDSPRTLGITLNRSLLMSPSKSVTAIIGLGPLQGSPPQR